MNPAERATSHSITLRPRRALRADPVHGAVVVLLGYLLTHLSQHTLTPHFHFGEETHHLSHYAGNAALIGLLLHTFFDGVAIASGFMVSPALGTLFFAAIFLHKLPEGVTASSLIVASGGTIGRAYAAAGALGLATIMGVLVTDHVVLLSRYGLSLASGVLLYVGASNLVPEFQGKRNWGIIGAFFAGAGTFLGAEAILEAITRG